MNFVVRPKEGSPKNSTLRFSDLTHGETYRIQNHHTCVFTVLQPGPNTEALKQIYGNPKSLYVFRFDSRKIDRFYEADQNFYLPVNVELIYEDIK